MPLRSNLKQQPFICTVFSGTAIQAEFRSDLGITRVILVLSCSLGLGGLQQPHSWVRGLAADYVVHLHYPFELSASSSSLVIKSRNSNATYFQFSAISHLLRSLWSNQVYMKCMEK